jgi:hypothetical protein
VLLSKSSLPTNLKLLQDAHLLGNVLQPLSPTGTKETWIPKTRVLVIPSNATQGLVLLIGRRTTLVQHLTQQLHFETTDRFWFS